MSITFAERDELQGFLDSTFQDRAGLRILEVGCGSRSNVRLGKDPYVVGLDLSRDQLDRNHELREKIQGDIQTIELPPASFDVAICWDVIEHLRFPRQALDRIFSCLRDGGLAILAGPNLYSVKGMTARLTPFRFHLWFYRRVAGWDRSADTTMGRFPTYLRHSSSLPAVLCYLEHNGHRVLFRRLYEHPVQKAWRRKRRWLDVVLKGLAGAASLATLKRADWLLSDYIVVAQKNG
ncbi:MAG: class I SAM-dependent methyltransferase [bacterium]